MSREPLWLDGDQGNNQTMHSKIRTRLTLHALHGLLGLVLCALAAAVLLAFSVVAHAAQPFDDQSFKQAQAAGKTVLIDVTAPWCPTCRQQAPIIAQIEKEKPNLVVYEVDFDTAKDTLKRFRVQYQSTLIVFKGTKEVGRSTGDTDPARIRALVAQGF
jgi:thioredoxin 1